MLQIFSARRHHRRVRTRVLVPLTAGLAAVSVTLTSCSTGDQETDVDGNEVAVDNCDESTEFPSPAQRIFVNEGAAVSNLFELDADDQIAAVAGVREGRQDGLAEAYGRERVEQLPIESDEYATVENVVAARPDTMIAGFHWGYSIEDNLTPDRLLADYDIPGYALSQTCWQESDGEQGIMPPLAAMQHDLQNIGEITGHTDRAASVLADVRERLDALAAAPEADSTPTVLYDNLVQKEGLLSGGAMSAADAIIEAAGGRNVLTDVDDDQPTISWEKITAVDPDFILIADFGGDYEDDVRKLKTNPATAELTAVQQDRFVRIPGLMTRGTPLNVDAAETLRQALEQHDLVPESSITPELELD